jgi:hypothetical protein
MKLCISNVCRGRLISVLCGEVSNRANNELMGLVIRHVKEVDLVREVLVGLIDVQDTTLSTLCDVVLSKLEKLRLPLDSIVGQCFDVASNMSGQYNGL